MNLPLQLIDLYDLIGMWLSDILSERELILIKEILNGELGKYYGYPARWEITIEEVEL